MRILMVNVQIGSGSAGTIVSDLYHGIVANSDDCKIAYSRGNTKDIPEENTIKIGNKYDSYMHAVKSRLFGSTATYSKRVTQEFLSRVGEFKPDIIHIHGLYGYYINMEMLFQYIHENRIGLVTTLHSCWDFTGHCCYFDYAGCEEWKNKCNGCPQKKSYPKSSFIENTEKNLVEKHILYHLLEKVMIVSPSKWMDGLVNQSILSDLKHIVINNGIDLNRFHKTIDVNYINELNINNDWPTVLSVASLWDKRKGLDDVIEFARFARTENINIVVVGLSEKQLEDLPENIVGIRRTDNIEQLISLYSYATVLFNPTYEDNYPTVNLESIACETPVITYHTGGSGECTMNGMFGSIIEKRDYKELLQILYSIHSGEKRYCFSDLSGIGKEKMIASYLDVYRNLVG